MMDVKVSKVKSLAYGMTDRTSSILDGIASRPVYKDKGDR